MIISFQPLYQEVQVSPATEKPVPWRIWTIAYALATLVVCLRRKNQYQDLVYPASMMFAHYRVAILTTRKA